MAKYVTITVRKVSGGWRGVVKVNGEFYAGCDTRAYWSALQECAHYASQLSEEMEGSDG